MNQIDTAALPISNDLANRPVSPLEGEKKPDESKDGAIVAKKSESSQKNNDQDAGTGLNQEVIDDIKANLEKINQFIPIQSTDLVFEFDELGEPPIVKVLDKNSQEVIREIPPKEFREVAKALEDVADKMSNTKGVLFEDSV